MLAAIATLGYLLGQPRPKLPRIIVPFSCPVIVGPHLAKMTGLVVGLWETAISTGTVAAPDISVSRVTVEGQEVCQLSIERGVPTRGAGIDWRLGFRLTPSKFIAGKQLVVRYQLQASEPVNSPTATLYVHDGLAGSGESLPVLEQGRRERKFTHTVSAEAPVVEVWLRLVFDRGVLGPSGAILYYLPMVDIED